MKKNAFEETLKRFQVNSFHIADLVSTYRMHRPEIYLNKGVKEILLTLKQSVYKVGLITDGRELQQRHKLEALGLQDYFDSVVISKTFGTERPAVRNF